MRHQHGTPACYRYDGCRCQACCESYQRANRQHRQYRAEHPFVRTPTDTLKALCWCQRTLGDVPVDDVKAGHTFACGRPNCHPPTG